MIPAMVVGEVFLHGWDLPEEVAEEHEAHHPHRRADKVISQKLLVVHLRDARDEGREGAHDDEEARQHDRLPSVLLVEHLGLLDVRLLEHRRVLLDDPPRRSKTRWNIHRVAEHGGDEEQREGELEGEDTGGAERPGGEEEGVAREERGDDEARLAEDDGEEDAVRERAVGGEEGDEMRVEVDDPLERVLEPRRVRGGGGGGGGLLRGGEGGVGEDEGGDGGRDDREGGYPGKLCEPGGPGGLRRRRDARSGILGGGRRLGGGETLAGGVARGADSDVARKGARAEGERDRASAPIDDARRRRARRRGRVDGARVPRDAAAPKCFARRGSGESYRHRDRGRDGPRSTFRTRAFEVPRAVSIPGARGRSATRATSKLDATRSVGAVASRRFQKFPHRRGLGSFRVGEKATNVPISRTGTLLRNCQKSDRHRGDRQTAPSGGRV